MLVLPGPRDLLDDFFLTRIREIRRNLHEMVMRRHPTGPVVIVAVLRISFSDFLYMSEREMLDREEPKFQNGQGL